MDNESNQQETYIPDEFDVWLGDRHKWIQTLAANLLEGVKYNTDEQLEGLADICMAEAIGNQSQIFKKPQYGYFSKPNNANTIAIKSLSQVYGVNAIKDDASLNFSTKGLTVIYGANGSGKTGFSRLLKQICGSRSREPELLGNVFSDNSVQTRALVSITKNETQEEDLEWTSDIDSLHSLRNVHVFDGKAALMYLEDKAEATYEPRQMRFISSLIKVSDKVNMKLSLAKAQLVSTLPIIPKEIVGSNTVKWLSKIKAGLPQSDIDKYCSFPQSLDDERVAIETSLAQKNIPARLMEITNEKKAFEQLKENFEMLKIEFSDEAISTYFNALTDANVKRNAASEYAEALFSQTPLDGVGQETWLELWKQARKFSVDIAYPNSVFPNTQDESRCVLCQQHLDHDAKVRLNHFEEFVTGGLESEAKAAEKVASNLFSKFPVIPNEANWKLQLNVLKMDEAQVIASLASLSKRSASISECSELDKVPEFAWSQLDDQAKKGVTALEEEEKTLNELIKDGKRLQLEARLLELKAMQWLSQNKQSVENEVERLGKQKEYDKAISLTNTVALTKKNNELALTELDAGYKKRFAEELKQLGGKRLSVTPISTTMGKGRVTFKVGLVGAKKIIDASLVLSEGENRIVALAAFLADISGSGQHTPFVFDDPISSLDQDFEEKVVDRLVELGRERQVIVFTHRLSLLTLIEGAIKKII